MANSKVLPPDHDQPHLLIRLATEDGCEVNLVSGGPRNAYLWIGNNEGNMHTTISGEKALRALADTILKELDAPQPRRKAHA